MKILVRLPNWLGDMVMSIGFINTLHEFYPGASISIIAKKGIHPLAGYFPGIDHQFIFSKATHGGLIGAFRFGREIRKKEKFDLFFCLPDSFSSAVMGYATGASTRIGFKQEFRSAFLTRTFQKPKGLHRVEEYIDLLQQYTGIKSEPAPIRLHFSEIKHRKAVVFNINSEAVSRRIPLDKAVSMITEISEQVNVPLYLVGGPADEAFVNSVHELITRKEKVINLAGKTNLGELVELLGSSTLVLTTDSGPAHVANATGVPTIVLFGAGNENNTAPYNKDNLQVIRLGQLPCEPCVSNTCKIYGKPKCLELLDEKIIVAAIRKITG